MVDESETAAKARQIDSEVIRSRAKLDKAQNELNATERKELLSFVPDFSVQLGQFSTSPTPERKRILRTTIPRIVFSGHQVVAVTLRFRPREAVSRASKGITPRAAFPIRNRTGMDSHFSVGHEIELTLPEPFACKLPKLLNHLGLPQREVYRTGDVCTLLGIRAATFRNRLASGWYPFLNLQRDGKGRLFTIQDLEALRKAETGPGS